MTSSRPGLESIDGLVGCPHATNAVMRDQASVVPIDLDGIEGRLVLSHRALRAMLTHPDVAKSPRHFAAAREGRVPEGWALRPFTLPGGVVNSDGADHRRLRSLIAGAFSRDRLERMRPRIEATVADLIDALPGQQAADGSVDLRRYLALPLAFATMSDLLGVDGVERGRVHELSLALVSGTTPREQLLATVRDLDGIVAGVVARRTEAPAEDLLSALIAARADDGSRLSETELLGLVREIVVAGHGTTVNLICNAVLALAHRPGQRDAVLAGEASWADVVEETLRHDAPVSCFPLRYPVVDLDLDGHHVPAGTPMLAGYSAAGRDPAAYGPDADDFDVRRRPTARLLSFGFGAHACPGAALARLEAAAALSALFGRHSGLVLAREPGPLMSLVSNGVAELPVRLDPPGR